MKLTIKLTGTKPMLMQNARLADPRNEYTQQIKAITGKRKKTDEDLMQIMFFEARGGCWETPDGLLGLPTANVWRGIYDAAKKYKLGEDVKRSLLFDDVVEPIEIKGEVVSCDSFLSNPENIDYRSVVIQKRRVMRARPRVPTGWKSEHTLELLTDVLDVKDLTETFKTFGRLVGIGNWRPIYGRVEVEVTSGSDGND